MELNQFEIIEKISDVDKILQNVSEELVKHNIGTREFNIETSPQLDKALKSLNATILKINRISNQE